MSLDGRHSINEVIGEVTRGLVPAITANEIQQRVCEEFVASELYSFVWIGRYNPEKEEIIPAASAGFAEKTLNEVPAKEEPPPQELANEVVRTREVAVRQNLIDDPPCEDWRDHARKQDYQTCAAIPLVYEKTLYGVLQLATTRSQGFGTAERESLAELGVTIAYAVETAESHANTDSTDRKEAETELTGVTPEPEQERRLYETIISSTPDLVYAFDLDYRFIFANEALLEMWGQTFEESIGKTLREIGYEPWHAEMHEREIDHVVETKEPIRGEVGFEHAELGRRIYDYIFAPVLNDEGEVEAIAGTTRDITERKEAEEALQKSEERFRALLDASSDVVYRMSHDWSQMQYLEGQDFIANIQEPTSDWLEKYIHPDDRERVTEAIDEAIRTKSTFELEHRVDQVDGTVGWTFSRAVPMLDDGGNIVEWIGMASDITEEKNRERDLERALDLLEKTELIADVGGWEIDPDTMDVFWTDHIFDLLEVPDDEEPPLEEALDMYHEDDQPVVEGAVENALDSGEPFDVEVRIRTASDEIRWLRLQGVPEIDDGDTVSFRGAAQDITEQVERERKLEETIDQLEESNERLESLASMIAHELRNPVAIGQIYSQRLPAETAPEAVDYVVEAFDRIENIVDVLLVLTHGRETVGERTPVSLVNVVQDAWDEVDAPDATLHVDIDGEIRGDQTYLQHLFRNLLENAVQHGGADVTVQVGGGSNEFFVADDGSGIPAENRDDVFKSGFTTTADEGGTGLGLAFVRELADLYGWSCAVSESAAGGARIEFQDVDFVSAG
ncbi:PAS domain-containing protein [Natrononativus amylolyticus]|uniref:PAS domain-containing protein n=1 Tax=Natrononativus amylolyticus TaxID=2963434 RepID=UPI0020CECCED|nr:PAS domain-containing protein [Natrononativus amylolyticus]